VFTDVTRKWSYSTVVEYSGDLTSADWIEEATGELTGEADLDNYGQVEFDFNDKAITTDETALRLPGFLSTDAISMNQGGLNGVYSTLSNPSGDQSGFYVTWTPGAPNQVFPPGPWIQTTSLPTCSDQSALPSDAGREPGSHTGVDAHWNLAPVPDFESAGHTLRELPRQWHVPICRLCNRHNHRRIHSTAESRHRCGDRSRIEPGGGLRRHPAAGERTVLRLSAI
jgi:hypothetical protein